ncbi:MAG: ATP-dependent dethiobiotin synthetase BioD, partial [Actinomycetota bacterium]
LVVVTGTGTEVGKTWWGAALARALGAHGRTVAARKPVQSYAPSDPEGERDAAVLGAATGTSAEAVCPPHRWLPEPMAPPMAAAHLGLPAFSVADLVAEITWPPDCAVGLVEGAGGLRSPLADDGDTRTLVDALDPDDVLIVAHTALGVVHGVRLVADALEGRQMTVALNHFDADDHLHIASRDWLVARDGMTVVTSPGELAARWA